MATAELLLLKHSWRNAINSLLFYENLQLCDRTLWVPGSWDWPRMVMWTSNREHELFMISQVVILQHSFGRALNVASLCSLKVLALFYIVYFGQHWKSIQSESIVQADVLKWNRERTASSPLCYANVAVCDWDNHCDGVLLRSGHAVGSRLIFHTGVWLLLTKADGSCGVAVIFTASL